MTSQPDNVLGIYEAFVEIDQAHTNIGDPKFVTNPWQSLLVKKDMSRVLESLVVALDEELHFAFDQRFGTNTQEWTDIPLLQTMKLIVAQGSSRFTVGLPLCKHSIDPMRFPTPTSEQAETKNISSIALTLQIPSCLPLVSWEPCPKSCVRYLASSVLCPNAV
jgi:hypothetical protein